MFSLSMIEDMMETQWHNGYGEVLPDVRFFTPTDEFWPALRRVYDRYDLMLTIDCGAGNGDTSREALAQGLKMGACDIYKRECHVGVEVQLMPAHRMPFDRRIWPIVCRPDHSGWCPALWQRALLKDAGFIYVGQPEKMEHDVQDLIQPDMVVEGIGQERENMYVWEPIPGLEEFMIEQGAI